MTFAGWIGLIVTALNLVPVGRRTARAQGIAFLALMVGAAVLFSTHWLMWAASSERSPGSTTRRPPTSSVR